MTLLNIICTDRKSDRQVEAIISSPNTLAEVNTLGNACLANVENEYGGVQSKVNVVIDMSLCQQKCIVDVGSTVVMSIYNEDLTLSIYMCEGMILHCYIITGTLVWM